MHINKIPGNGANRQGKEKHPSSLLPPLRFRSRSIAFSSSYRKKRARSFPQCARARDQFRRRVTSGRVEEKEEEEEERTGRTPAATPSEFALRSAHRTSSSCRRKGAMLFRVATFFPAGDHASRDFRARTAPRAQ